MKQLNIKTTRAYQLKLAFQELFEQHPSEAPFCLQKWYFWATHSRLEPVRKATKTIKEHWAVIIRWFDSKIYNGILEDLNSLIQAAKRLARVYKIIDKLIAMIYLVLGKLSFQALCYSTNTK